MRLGQINSFVIGSVAIAMVVAFAGEYLEAQVPWLRRISAIVVAAGIAIWILVNTAAAIWATANWGRGRYAVLLFVLNDAGSLLLIQHPFHKRLMPPGGRLRMWELPHEAIARVLVRHRIA